MIDDQDGWEQVTCDQLREGDMVRTMVNVHAPDPPLLYWRRGRPPVAASDRETGISIRFVRQYDIAADQRPTPFDSEVLPTLFLRPWWKRALRLPRLYRSHRAAGRGHLPRWLALRLCWWALWFRPTAPQ